MTLGGRIRKSRLAKRLKQAELARRLNVTRNAVSMWERDEAEPKAANLRALAILLDRSHEWLSTGRGSQGGTQSTVEGLREIGDIAAGVWHEVVETQDVEFKRVPAAPDPRYPVEAQYALRIRGNSVNRIAADGDIVHCVDINAASIDVRDGDLVWVERHQGHLIESTIKRVRRASGGLELWPESDDPAHQEKLSYKPAKGAGEVVIRGLVLWVLKQVQRGT
jgi:transcriptional regulator with XRE-family HTH domain